MREFDGKALYAALDASARLNDSAGLGRGGDLGYGALLNAARDARGLGIIDQPSTLRNWQGWRHELPAHCSFCVGWSARESFWPALA